MIDHETKQLYRFVLKCKGSIVGVKKNFWNVYEVGVKIYYDGFKRVDTCTLRPKDVD